MACIALTPHARLDNIEGLTRAREIGQLVIPGIETHVESSGFLFHILGFFSHVSYDAEFENAFNAEAAKLDKQREKYLFELISNAEKEHNTTLGFEKVKNAAGNFGIGVYPSISKVLGLEFLGLDFESFNPSANYGFTLSASVKLIHDFGGKAVLAHPRWIYPNFRSMQRIIRSNINGFIGNSGLQAPKGLTVSGLYNWLGISHPLEFKRFSFDVTRQWLNELYMIIENEVIPAGIDGIETHTAVTELPNYPSPKKEYLKIDQELVSKYKLKESAGTDYHGRSEEDVEGLRLGVGVDYSFKIPVSAVSWLF